MGQSGVEQSRHMVNGFMTFSGGEILELMTMLKFWPLSLMIVWHRWVIYLYCLIDNYYYPDGYNNITPTNPIHNNLFKALGSILITFIPRDIESLSVVYFLIKRTTDIYQECFTTQEVNK